MDCQNSVIDYDGSEHLRFYGNVGSMSEDVLHKGILISLTEGKRQRVKLNSLHKLGFFLNIST